MSFVILQRRHMFLRFALIAVTLLLFLAWNFRKASLSNDINDKLLQSIAYSSNRQGRSKHNFGLRGPPARHFRDNLNANLQYITTFGGAGFTNEVMNYANLIYLGWMTRRIPIIPRFARDYAHIQGDTATLNFDTVFDVHRLSDALHLPILQWQDVKDVDAAEADDLGCWSIFTALAPEENRPHYSDEQKSLSLDISYTAAPTWIKLLPPEYWEDMFSNMQQLMKLSYPEVHQHEMEVSIKNGATINGPHGYVPPDPQFLCYDYLYWVSVLEPHEYMKGYYPVWHAVLRHMHFTKELQQIADDHLRKTLNVPEKEPMPDYISVHVRHGDFGSYHCHGLPLNQCYAPLRAYARRVREVQTELRQRDGGLVTHVIVTSDETDPEWWEGVHALGWKNIDFKRLRTEETYNSWYPTLIDAVVQGSASGFVGTDGSTMSIIAGRRVQEWQGGPTRLVKWGKPGSDNYDTS